MKTRLNHVALLVQNIETTLEETKLKEFAGPIEEFPSEGTRECYVKDLLLMEAISEGPYLEAFSKRGAGLHHIALDVENIENYLAYIHGSGWLLHPKSLSFYKNSKMVFLCRPGTPVLIEIQEVKEFGSESDSLVQKLTIPFGGKHLREALGCEKIHQGPVVALLTTDGEVILEDEK